MLQAKTGQNRIRQLDCNVFNLSCESSMDVVYYDRYQKRNLVEKIYGERSLRWAYGTVAGRVSLHVLVKRALFSRWYGWRMDQPASRRLIAPFIRQYSLDVSEFRMAPDQFQTFNEFFFRQLKVDARPVNPDPKVVVFPADGRHLCIPDLSRAQGLFVKGQNFSLGDLLQNSALTERYAGGSLLLSRLCPVDYHRFHFPVGGTPQGTRMIQGPLFSVNPVALRQNIRILAQNKRCITELQTPHLGTVLLLEIGATCVGTICQTFAAGKTAAKGDEKGYFRFGGSSTITIFEPGRVQFDADLLEQSSQHREVYARQGDHMAVAR